MIKQIHILFDIGFFFFFVTCKNMIWNLPYLFLGIFFMAWAENVSWTILLTPQESYVDHAHACVTFCGGFKPDK